MENASKRPDGVTILSLWYLVLAGGALFGACATSLPIGVVTLHPDMAGGGRFIASVLLGLGLGAALFMAVVFGLAAWGLWRLREWGRIGAMVLALLHLPFFPMGTVIGIATLWYLSSHDDAVAAFRRQ